MMPIGYYDVEYLCSVSLPAPPELCPGKAAALSFSSLCDIVIYLEGSENWQFLM